MSCTLSDRITTDLAVIGGGIVGLASRGKPPCGHRVVLIDPAPGTGATFAAAGMLAPVSELHHQEEDLLELTLASAERWPAFAASLPAGPPKPLFDHADAGGGRRPRRPPGAGRPVRGPASAGAGGHPAEPQGGPGARTHAVPEPCRGLPGAARPPGRSARGGPAILAAWRLPPGKATRRRAAPSWRQRRRPAARGPRKHPLPGRRRAAGGRTRGPAREVVLANGLGAADLGGLPQGLPLPLRPVYGDILRLRVPENLRPLTTATLRGLVRGLPVYVVPRSDGTVVIGATSREDGSPGVSAGGVHQLLRDAQVLLPAVAELELLETTARARPGTPDNAPLLGRVADAHGTDIPGLVIATGFFRHGVLLTPIAAHITTELLRGRSDPAWDRFRPDRFSPALHLRRFHEHHQLNGATHPWSAEAPWPTWSPRDRADPAAHRTPRRRRQAGRCRGAQLGHRPAQPMVLHRAQVNDEVEIVTAVQGG